LKGKYLVSTAMLLIATPAFAHSSSFKSPGPGMHFTQGQPLVVYADLFDDRDGKGIIVCPSGQTISNMSPPPDYGISRVAQCSGGGTPTGWPQLQLLIDGNLQTDNNTGSTTYQNTISFNHDGNPDPIGYFPFSAPTAGLAPGAHQVVARGHFSADAVNVTTVDSSPITIYIDAPPSKSVVTLTADVNGPVNWDNVIVVGNGHAVTATGDLVIHNSLVTGLAAPTTAGLSGTVNSIDIEGSIFEDSGALNLTSSGAITITGNEFRANNRLKFVASDPSVPFEITVHGNGSGTKLFQGNRVGAGQLSFNGDSWLIGGDTDDASNIFIGPRCVLNVNGSNLVIRGNYAHHNYRGAWSQGFNFVYSTSSSNVLTEHNFIRDSSWPVQQLAGEFRYNVVFGYGHTWIRSANSNAVVHHNIFTPGGDGDPNDGVMCYQSETGLVIYNNTFDGGGNQEGDMSAPTIGISGTAQVLSLRNNLITFSRNLANGSPGATSVVGGPAGYVYVDYNSFYSPDNDNKTAYDFTGTGVGGHDVSGTGALGVVNGQLAATPFAGARIVTDDDRIITDTIDESAVWQGTQKLSYVLAAFRARYTPAPGSPIIDAGDPQDNDSKGRRADIGAIDSNGHDQDKLGTFGNPPAELVPPTVTLTAPTAGQVLTGSATVSATAQDNPGGSGVVLVQFLADGAVVAQRASSPYSTSFDSAALVNGSHVFTAKAWDAAGNSAVSAPITAQTMNAGGGGVVGGGGSGGGNTGGGAHGGAAVIGGCACSSGASGDAAVGWLAALLAAIAATGLVLARRRARR
jgi:hypothetical protein